MRVFMWLASYANDEVSETIAAVDAIDYQTSVKWGDSGGKELDDSPRGPIERYDRTNIIEDAVATFATKVNDAEGGVGN